jgi:hypothetical protein
MATLFPQQAHWLSPLPDFELMTSIPDEWQKYIILGSGTHEFLRLTMPKLRLHVGPFVFANDMIFSGRRRSEIDRLYRSWAAHDYKMGLESITVRHADFGGIMSAVHDISFRGVDRTIFAPSTPLTRTCVMSYPIPHQMPSRKSPPQCRYPTPTRGPQFISTV